MATLIIPTDTSQATLGYLLADGSIPLTGTWDAGGFDIKHEDNKGSIYGTDDDTSLVFDGSHLKFTITGVTSTAGILSDSPYLALGGATHNADIGLNMGFTSSVVEDAMGGVYTYTGSTLEIRGLAFRARHDGTNTNQATTGVLGFGVAGDGVGATFGRIAGAIFQWQTISGAGTTTDGVGMRIATPSKAAGTTVTNSVAIEIASQSTTATNRYQIRELATTGFNVLAGNTSIGTTSDPASGIALDVVGDTKVAGTLDLFTLTDNVVIGTSAGASLISGALRNVLIGHSAGNAMTDSDDTVMVGDDAGLLNTAAQNVFIGSSAGAANTSGTGVVYIGYQAGILATGVNNMCIGSGAGAAITTGTQNVCFGTDAGNAISTQANNVFIGFQAGLVTTDEKAMFIGALAGKANTTGTNNTFIGFQAGLKNVTSDANTFIGVDAGSNSTATRNTFIGSSAGSLTTSGQLNTALGQEAGRDNDTGSNNVFLGDGADVTGGAKTSATALGTLSVIGGDESIAIGVLATTTAANQLVIGSNDQEINDAYLGSGVLDTAPTDIVLNATGGSGTDIAGASFTLGGGKPTGAGAGGSLILSTAPAGSTGTTLRALVARLTINSAGLVTIANDAIVNSRDVNRYAYSV